jgi:hypothetical protein
MPAFLFLSRFSQRTVGHSISTGKADEKVRKGGTRLRAKAPNRCHVVSFDRFRGHHFEGVSQGYGQFLLGLSQISTITVLVYGSMLNVNDISRVSQLFSMTKLFSLTSEEFQTGFATFEREIGVPVDSGVTDTSCEYETTRKREDESRRKEVHQWLSEADVPCSLANICSRQQPGFDEENGYWASR